MKAYESINWEAFTDSHPEYETRRLKEMKKNIPELDKLLAKLGTFKTVDEKLTYYAGWYWILRLKTKRKYHALICYTNNMFRVKICRGDMTYIPKLWHRSQPKWIDDNQHGLVIQFQGSPSSINKFYERLKGIVNIL